MRFKVPKIIGNLEISIMRSGTYAVINDIRNPPNKIIVPCTTVEHGNEIISKITKAKPGDLIWLGREELIEPKQELHEVNDLEDSHGADLLPKHLLDPTAAQKLKSRIMYIEQKNRNDNGPARIGRVIFSKTGKTIYYKGKKFRSLKGRGISANYFDIDNGDEYWISGCKKNGQDHHWAGSGPVEIDDEVREEYWIRIRKMPNNINKEKI